MISAFGIEHGISKSFRKLAPKLKAADEAYQKRGRQIGPKGSEWPQENYVQFRHHQGQQGNRKHRIMDKEMARSMYTIIRNRNKESGRKLP